MNKKGNALITLVFIALIVCGAYYVYSKSKDERSSIISFVNNTYSVTKSHILPNNEVIVEDVDGNTYVDYGLPSAYYKCRVDGDCVQFDGALCNRNTGRCLKPVEV